MSLTAPLKDDEGREVGKVIKWEYVLSGELEYLDLQIEIDGKVLKAVCPW